MKFEKLNDSKIRIFFTQKDMDLNNISTNDVLSNNDTSQKLLESLIFEAENKIGFKTDDSKLLIEAISSLEEGLIFTITKINTYCVPNMNCPLIFKFESFDDFMNLCSYIENMNYYISKNCFSLFSYNNSYYLYIYDFSNISSLLNIINEFGEPIQYSIILEGLINEYGNLIFNENAILEGLKFI